MAKKSSGGRGMSFFSLLTVLFIGLKLTDQIDWSWWWVLSPIWGGALLFVVALIAYAVTRPTYR